MRIVLTGASSFTGFWFARTLAEQGHAVVAPLSSAEELYKGVRAERLALLRDCCDLRYNLSFGSADFLSIVEAQSQIDVFCHHWSQVRNYRSPDFDAASAFVENTRGFLALLALLSHRKCQTIVLTGSIGEQREGLGPGQGAFSPYGLSKGLTSDFVAFHCERSGMKFGKFVVPNPFGPYEDARFTHYLMGVWARGDVARVKNPDYVRDNIHVDLLARAYGAFVQRVIASPASADRFSPSLYAETQGAFTLRVAREVRARTGWDCGVMLETQSDFSEPMSRVNVDATQDIVPDWSEAAGWDAFVAYYRNRGAA